MVATDAGKGARLTLELLREGLIAGKPVRDHLDGNQSPEGHFLGLVHDAHTAAPKHFEDAVAVNLLADERVGGHDGRKIVWERACPLVVEADKARDLPAGRRQINIKGEVLRLIQHSREDVGEGAAVVDVNNI